MNGVPEFYILNSKHNNPILHFAGVVAAVVVDVELLFSCYKCSDYFNTCIIAQDYFTYLY